MAIKSLIKFFSNTPVMLMLRIGKLTKETCRTGFVLTAISEGIYDIMQSGPATFEEIQNSFKSDFNPEGLRAWLDLGVSLGELKKSTNGYSIKGKLSKELIKPANDTWRAFLQVRAEVFYDFIINTPSMLKKNMQFEYSEAYGELVAKGHGCQAYTVDSLCLFNQMSQPRLAPDERVKADVSRIMIEAHISQRYPRNDPRSVAYRNELIRVCNEFVKRGLADRKFVRELTSGQDSKFWACISEALLADRLRNKDFPERSAVGEGPDFLVADGDLKIWVEVICPEASGIPAGWLSIGEGVTDFPHVDILLRWTAAIKEKAEKLIGNADGTITGYLKKGIVASNEAYVIAVNGCQLRNGPFSALFGISQFPFAAEAVFPIGPIQLRVNRETQKVVDQGHQHRPYIINRNNAQVPAYTFLDPRFNPISAIWAVDVNGGSAIGNTEPMAVIHNPNALNPISIGFMPADNEYVATPCSEDEFLLEKIDSENISDGKALSADAKGRAAEAQRCPWCFTRLTVRRGG